MTKDVIAMAREAGFAMENSAAIQAAERFATLVRNAALEEAAQKCKQLEIAIDGGGNAYYRPADARQCVAAIESLKEPTP